MRGRPPDLMRPDGLGGPECCGAPAVAVASAKFSQRHRSGKGGSVWPCVRALACEAAYRRMYRTGGRLGWNPASVRKKEVRV